LADVDVCELDPACFGRVCDRAHAVPKRQFPLR
jgi:hypothetical protein